jgi:hypothetical protein
MKVLSTLYYHVDLEELSVKEFDLNEVDCRRTTSDRSVAFDRSVTHQSNLLA